MTEQYRIEGMTCQNCVRRVKDMLLAVPEVETAEVQLEFPQAKIALRDNLSVAQLGAVLGKYKISSLASAPNVQTADKEELAEKSLTTYKPLLLIVGFISLVTLLAQYPFQPFSAMTWMRHFMAGFFIVFSFFKLLNLSGFADSYSMYDIVAQRWKAWGFIYPFVELALGLLYLTNLAPRGTNIATIMVLGISSIGVIRSVLNSEKIKCACLGDVFNLPMSTVTIIEDVSMVAMAVVMLFLV